MFLKQTNKRSSDEDQNFNISGYHTIIQNASKALCNMGHFTESLLLFPKGNFQVFIQQNLRRN